MTQYQRLFFSGKYDGCLPCTVGDAWAGPLATFLIFLVVAGLVYSKREWIRKFMKQHKVRRGGRHVISERFQT